MRLYITARTVLGVSSVLAVTLPACTAPDAPAQAAQNAAEPWNWSEEYVRSVVNQVRAGRDLNPPPRGPVAPE